LILMSLSSLQINAIRSLGSTQAREWVNTYGKAILAQVPKQEVKRQEIIFELILTEEDYVNDLKMIVRVMTTTFFPFKQQQQQTTTTLGSQLFMEPAKQGLIPLERATVCKKIFRNLNELIEVNSKFLAALKDRQREKPVVDNIGDIFQKYAGDLQVYLNYCPNGIGAKVLLDEEAKTNHKFQNYLQRMQRSTECRKLPLENLLMFPVQRVPRYNLVGLFFFFFFFSFPSWFVIFIIISFVVFSSFILPVPQLDFEGN